MKGSFPSFLFIALLAKTPLPAHPFRPATFLTSKAPGPQLAVGVVKLLRKIVDEALLRGELAHEVLLVQAVHEEAGRDGVLAAVWLQLHQRQIAVLGGAAGTHAVPAAAHRRGAQEGGPVADRSFGVEHESRHPAGKAGQAGGSPGKFRGRGRQRGFSALEPKRAKEPHADRRDVGLRQGQAAARHRAPRGHRPPPQGGGHLHNAGLRVPRVLVT